MAEIIASTYEVIGEIGSGGGGTVYLANHLRLNKRVVLKADKRKITSRPEILRREVDVLKNLSHPYIPQVYDFFAENDTVYTVMDYIEGESLDKPLKRGEKFPQPQVIQWAKQLLSALSYLHSPTHGTPPKGFVHSDVKPANLMRRPDNSICLIDFNIALALGEITAVGASVGYASPEHYGLDFSTDDDTETMEKLSGRAAGFGKTVTMPAETTETMPDPSSARTVTMAVLGMTPKPPKKKVIVPDVRSDIYSVGATLYHLLSGQRPARNAKEVIPLSPTDFSPQIVAIITKAMNPNPNLRYQSADEMLDAFAQLRGNDPRMRLLRRSNAVGFAVFSVMFLAGACAGFAGLKRMQTTESWLKLAEYSRNSLAEGDTEDAIGYALEALPERSGILVPEYTAQAQEALADALGVYDLSDGFKPHGTIELPSAPLYMQIAPDGKTACVMYAYSAAVIDMDSARITAELPAVDSALAEVRYLDNDTIVFAGEEGLQAYDIRQDKIIWTGEPATAVSVSADGKRAAAVYKDENLARIYDTENGQVEYTVDFGGKHQWVAANDSFANPNDNLLTLNSDGTQLGVSFSDGSLRVYDLAAPEKDMEIFDEGSGYTHFEGGFYGRYFACSALSAKQSEFAVVDTATARRTGGFQSDSYYGVLTDEEGIYVQTDNLLVKIHPVTGEQTALATTTENIRSFAHDRSHTLIAAETGFMFFGQNAVRFSSCEYEEGYLGDFVEIAEGMAMVGSRNDPAVRILRYENHPDAGFFTYDPSYEHDEARVSADGTTVMLFSYKQFRLYGIDGKLIAEVTIPDEEQVYDQQYVRDEPVSYLEVTYYDGTIRTYSASDGHLLSEERSGKPPKDLYEEFFTDELRIESPLHGTPAAYSLKSGKLVGELAEDAYLTYVTQTGDYIVAQYVTTDGVSYGELLNGKCEVLAELPNLCDVIGEELIFDYPTGNLRRSRIYNTGELLEIAHERTGGTKQ